MSAEGHDKPMNITIEVWRQKGPEAPGGMCSYQLDAVNPHMSFLEMLDVLNEQLIAAGEEPVAFDHDCREGICGTCSMVVDGLAHGPEEETTICQQHMRRYRDGDVIRIEPFRANAFTVLRDLVVDRSSLDRIQAAGGFISANTGAPQDANALPIAKEMADLAMDAAACIGCGACVAACPNASAMLFVAAKVSHLSLLPQGQAEKKDRVVSMVRQMDQEGFGNCTNHYECQAACPKGISVENIARMNRQFAQATLSGRSLD